MEGIPANKSTIVPNSDAIFFPLKYSPIKRATGNEKGKQNKIPKIEVIMVPMINARAPYFSLPSVGFHSEDDKNSKKPNCLKAGIAPLVSD